MPRPATPVRPPGYDEALARLEERLEVLPDKPDETPESALRALWARASGRMVSLSQASGCTPQPLDGAGARRLHELIDSRLDGVPLAYLTGRQDFFGMVLMTDPTALIPRRETELLARHANEKLEGTKRQQPLAIDICCGSGNVTLAMAQGMPSARVFGSDLDEGAVALARANAAFTGHPEVTFRRGDLLEPFDEPEFLGRVDVITCNPPYISSGRVDEMPAEIRRHEPRLAFDGGALGVTILRRLAAETPRWLRPGGWFVCEVGLGQGPTIARLLARNSEFDDVETVLTAASEVRVVAARRGAPDPSTRDHDPSTRGVQDGHTTR